MKALSGVWNVARRPVSRGQPFAWMVGLVAVLVCSTVYAAYTLGGRAETARETTALLSRLQASVGRFEHSRMTIAIGGSREDELDHGLVDTGRSDTIVQTLLGRYGGEGDVGAIVASYWDYQAAIAEDSRLAPGSGDPAARAAVVTRVDHAYERFTALLEDGLRAQEEVAHEMERAATAASVILGSELVLAMALLALLYRRHRRRLVWERAQHSEVTRSEARFRTFIANSTDMVTVLDAAGTIQFASPACEPILGYQPADLVGHNVSEFVHPDDIEAAMAGLGAALLVPGVGSGSPVVRVRDEAGTWRHMQTTANNLMNDPGIRGIVYNMRDVTERKTAELEQERLLSVLEATSDIVVVADRAGHILHANRSFRAVVGIEGEALAPDLVWRFFPESARSKFAEECRPAVLAHGRWHGEVAFLTVQGEEVPVECEVLAHHGPAGELAYFSCVARDVTERKRFESQLIHIANHDPLTGLFNRRRFEEELVREVGRSHLTGQSSAVLFLDIDSFKAVNDGAGHRSGDDLLRAVAETLADVAGPADIVARMGGDEFAVLLFSRSIAEAEWAAESIRTAVHDHRLSIHGEMVSTTLSIGVVMLPDHGGTVHDLLTRADLAMYEAKTDRDSYRVFSHETDYHRELTTRRVWEERIRAAVENDAFVLHAQPIRYLDGTVRTYELLLRMVENDGTLILPGNFLPIAERSGLIHLIDHWVVRRAMELIREHEAAGLETRFAVNISARSLVDLELPRILERGLRETGIDPSRLTIEITETAAIADLDEARRFIGRLTRLGLRFAIDDFGAGFASFTYLKRLPVDDVKIDGSFIRNLPRDIEDQHIVGAMITIAHAMGKKVTAEFVEDEETLLLLKGLNVDYVQGYYLGRPGPLTTVSRQEERRAA